MKTQGHVEPSNLSVHDLSSERAQRYLREEEEDQRQMRAADVVREIGYITLSDGVMLSIVIYRKKSAELQPVILELSPYMTGSVRFSGLSYGYGRNPQFWLNNGFAYAGVDIRGTTCSNGELSFFSLQNGADGKEVVEWLGEQPWTDGVGMVGISYPGHMAMFTAARQPKHLKAIAVSGVTADLYSDGCYLGGMFTSSFIPWWSAADASEGAFRRRFWGDQKADVGQAKTKYLNAYDELKQHPFRDDFWQPRGIESFAERIQVPMFLIQGFQEDAVRISGGVRNWQLASSPLKKMLLQNGGHLVANRAISQAEIVRFMERHLAGVSNGVDEEPPVRIWWEVHDVFGSFMKYPSPETDQANWQTSHQTWPPEGVRDVTFQLSGDGTLQPGEPKSLPDDGARRYMFPAGTELHADNIQFAITPEPHGSLNYRTEPLAEDMTLLGHSVLDFYVSSENADTDFLIALHDIDELGNVIFIQKVYLRASLRGLDEERSTNDYPRQSFEEAQPLVPNEVTRITLAIPEVAYVVRRGHRLELSVMAPSNIGTPYWGFSLVNMPGYNTIYASTRYPSSLTLSVHPELKAEAPMPPSGTMEGLWCRKPEFRSRTLITMHWVSE